MLRKGMKHVGQLTSEMDHLKITENYEETVKLRHTCDFDLQSRSTSSKLTKFLSNVEQ